MAFLFTPGRPAHKSYYDGGDLSHLAKTIVDVVDCEDNGVFFHVFIHDWEYGVYSTQEVEDGYPVGKRSVARVCGDGLKKWLAKVQIQDS